MLSLGGVREGPRNARPAAVAGLALLALRRRLALSAIGALAAVHDHRHVRVVLVVLDHLVEELILELGRDHAIDHALIIGRGSVCARGERCRGQAFRPPRGAHSSARTTTRAPADPGPAPRGAPVGPTRG